MHDVDYGYRGAGMTSRHQHQPPIQSLFVFPLALAKPLADVALALLLLGDGQGQDHTGHHHHWLPQLARPLSTTVAHGIDVPSPRLYQSEHDVFSDGAASATMMMAMAAGSSSSSEMMDSQYEWNLPNGKVQFERPLSFAGMTMQDGELKSAPASSSISLWDPTFLGSGGSGAVFSFSTNNPTNEKYDEKRSASTFAGKDTQYIPKNVDVAIKVSWKRSRQSVENECNILQSLENVPHVERCVGRPNSYPYEDGRVTIALTPVVESLVGTLDDITSSLKNVKPGQPQRNAVKSVVETMVGMLRLDVYTIDVQPLISMETGEVLFIDFTEAKHFSNTDNSLTPADEAALVGFCSEMVALIPDPLRDVAVQYLTEELEGTSNNYEHMLLSEKVVDIVKGIWID